jgi:hypothetical protein
MPVCSHFRVDDTVSHRNEPEDVVDLRREGAGIEHVRAGVDHGLVPFQRVRAARAYPHARDISVGGCQVLTIWVLCNRPAQGSAGRPGPTTFNQYTATSVPVGGAQCFAGSRMIFTRGWKHCIFHLKMSTYHSDSSLQPPAFLIRQCCAGSR